MFRAQQVVQNIRGKEKISFFYSSVIQFNCQKVLESPLDKGTHNFINGAK